MSQDWYYAINNKQEGPVSEAELRDLAERGKLSPRDLVWKDGMAEWVPASTVRGLLPEPRREPERREPERRDDYRDRDRDRGRDDYRDRDRGIDRDRDRDYDRGRDRDRDRDYDRGPRRPRGDSNRVACGVVAILIGGLGIHKFMLGMSTPGLIMLLVTLLTCGIGGMVMGVIGIVEGVIYLTKSDDEFYELYVVQKKEWF